MRNESFEKAVETIIQRDPAYPTSAYSLIAIALEYTMRRCSVAGHVSGRQLSEGLRDYMLEEFGPFAQDVLYDCRIRKTSDIGRIVYNLIDVGAFGKTEHDTIEDFDNLYDFEATFTQPFRAKND